VKDLNDQRIAQFLASSVCDLVISTNLNIEAISILNKISREKNIKMIAGRVVGNSGFVFNDLLSNYTVNDTDGENYKEVSFLSFLLTELSLLLDTSFRFH
jgi:molybdopterin/thiamine biosynthesis adenylyltransferase